MCGIIGIASTRHISERSWLVSGRDAMIHRGPDDCGEWWSVDGRVGLAHRRLAILDLSSAGHQPMQDANSGRTVVFNGEIYNHSELRQELYQAGYRFQSMSDTEVLLAAYDAWGDRFLQRLVGMFAFAIHDPPGRRLLLARDRAGEKPLFYHSTGKTLCFASEMKGLFANPEIHRKIDPDSLDLYLTIGYVPAPRCLVQGFQKLPAGHAMAFNLDEGGSETWRYWQLPDAEPDQGADSDDDLVGKLEQLLEDAVSSQLVADVPVGVMLSGGVDSSLVTAMAVRTSPKVKTFTIGFPGHGQLDETSHARLIAKHFGTEHIELAANPATASMLPRLARQFDEPMVDSSMFPTFLVSQLVRQHCTVALGGDGGDELFGGYGHYSRLLWMQSRLGFIPLPVRRAIARGATALLPVGFRGRNWLQGLGMDLDRGLPLIANYFDKGARLCLTNGTCGKPCSAEELLAQQISCSTDLLQRATRMDFQHYLSEDILVKVDRASMLNSLEIRAPFLDHRLIEFAFARVPTRLKSSYSERKVLLKLLAKRLLPPEFDRRRKQGFGIPLNSWLKKGPFRDLFWDVLLDSNTIFDRKMIQQLLNGQDKGRGNGERLFALVLFELWRREYSVSA